MIDIHIAALRVAIAFVFGAVIGIEREWRHKNAGVKTNTFVCVGSAVFALMSNSFGPENHNPAQLAAAVVSGIGFIGAGVIIHRGANVQGVTTAATLWANASMGLAVGLGYYSIAALAFGAIVVTQFGLRRVVAIIANRGPRSREIEIRIECSEAALHEVNQAWSEFLVGGHAAPLRRTLSRSNGHVVWRATFIATPDNGLDLTTVEERLVSVPGVAKIEAQQTVPGAESM